MYWSATGKSAHFSLTVLNEVKKWQINLRRQDQTREEANRGALFWIKYMWTAHEQTHANKRLECEPECRPACNVTYAATTSAASVRHHERLEDNWWYFCAGASSSVTQISHLLCRWARTVELTFGSGRSPGGGDEEKTRRAWQCRPQRPLHRKLSSGFWLLINMWNRARFKQKMRMFVESVKVSMYAFIL